MKDTLSVGLTTKKVITIDEKRTISFMGEEGRVYSTPSMVTDIEYTCHELLQKHLEEGENSVGTHISVDHVGATVEGDKIEIHVEIESIEGRAVSMTATVRDSLEKVGLGKHNRFIVNEAKTFDRLKEKRDKIFGN
ncbi:MAG: hotdog domain-containing protein [Pseudomonadota bacterium]|nr:hotdog domain-containing protein [Pseudomonadota bacterium]